MYTNKKGNNSQRKQKNYFLDEKTKEIILTGKMQKKYDKGTKSEKILRKK